MKRRILCILLLLCLLLSACAGEAPVEAEAPEENQPAPIDRSQLGQKVAAFYLSPRSGLGSLAEEEDILLWESVADFQEEELLAQEIEKLLQAPEAGAVLLNENYSFYFPETLNFSEILDEAEVRESPQFWVGCAGGEGTYSLARELDLLLEFNISAQARRMVEQAKQMGAETLVYYIQSAHLFAFADQDKALAAVLQSCAEQDIRFVPVVIPKKDVYDWEPILRRDVAQQVETYGTNTAFAAIEGEMQWRLTTYCGLHGAIYPGSLYPRVNIEDPASLRPNAEGTGPNGRFADFPIASKELGLRAAYEYARLWLAGEVPADAISLPRLEQIMEEISGVDCHLEFESYFDNRQQNHVFYYLEPQLVEWE